MRTMTTTFLILKSQKLGPSPFPKSKARNRFSQFCAHTKVASNTCGTSYKAPTSVNYDSRAVNIIQFTSNYDSRAEIYKRNFLYDWPRLCSKVCAIRVCSHGRLKDDVNALRVCSHLRFSDVGFKPRVYFYRSWALRPAL